MTGIPSMFIFCTMPFPSSDCRCGRMSERENLRLSLLILDDSSNSLFLEDGPFRRSTATKRSSMLSSGMRERSGPVTGVSTSIASCSPGCDLTSILRGDSLALFPSELAESLSTTSMLPLTIGEVLEIDGCVVVSNLLPGRSHTGGEFGLG